MQRCGQQTKSGKSCKNFGNPHCHHHRQAESQAADDCSICLHSLGHTRNVEVLRCNHKFHRACLRQWEQNSCPLCRNPIQETQYKVTIVVENLHNGRVARTRLGSDMDRVVGERLNEYFGIPVNVSMLSEIDLERDILANLMDTMRDLGIPENIINIP